MNGDDFDDLVVVESHAAVAGKVGAGAVWLLYGPLQFQSPSYFASSDPATSELMGEVDLPFVGSPPGVSAGDVNGDGHVDLAFGSPNFSQTNPVVGGVGRAHLFFGPDFRRELILLDPTPEQESYFGRSVLLADVTADGRDELIIGAPDASALGPHGSVLDSVGEVWVWTIDNGPQTPLLISHPQPEAQARFGSSLDVVALNQVTPNRLMIGANDQGLSGAVHSFMIPELEYDALILPPFLTEGGALAFGDTVYCGELTGDGSDDLVVTAWLSFIGCQGAGAVFVLEGPSFQTASRVLTSPRACSSTASLGFGWKTVVTDLDRDGTVDIIASDSGQPWGEQRAYVFYGPDFATIQELGADFEFITVGFGGELAVGDYDGDGWSECAIAAEEGSGSGSVYLHDVQTLASDKPALSASLGGTIAFHFNASVAQAADLYLAVISMSGSSPGIVPSPGVFVPLNVDVITHIGLSLLNGPLMPGFIGALDSEGQASFQLQLPPNSIGGLVGQTLTIAAVTATPGGNLVSGSSAAAVIVIP